MNFDPATVEAVRRMEREHPALCEAWKAMARCEVPRNLHAIQQMRDTGKLKDGDLVVVSFVGQTRYPEPHLYCNSGRRYDLRVLANLNAAVVVRPGIGAGQVLADLAHLTRDLPILIDVERQIRAEVIESTGGALKLWPSAQGGRAWLECFG